MTMRRIVFVVFFAFFGLHAASQTMLGVAYYDVDRLYDTVPALFYNDDAYTPQGRMRWNSERYFCKIRHTAAVIDSMALPIVGVWGVENESVVRDLAAACRGDYSYLHCTLNEFSGLDFVLLYYGDRFYPHHSESGRGYLYVEGIVRGSDTVGILLCSQPKMTEWVVRELRDERPRVKLIVMGRAAEFRSESFGLRNATVRAENAGRGNVRRRGSWEMRDRIWVDTLFDAHHFDVFARRYLIDKKAGSPIPTYLGGVYRGGYSRSLPIYGYIR